MQTLQSMNTEEGIKLIMLWFFKDNLKLFILCLPIIHLFKSDPINFSPTLRKKTSDEANL